MAELTPKEANKAIKQAEKVNKALQDAEKEASELSRCVAVKFFDERKEFGEGLEEKISLIRNDVNIKIINPLQRIV